MIRILFILCGMLIVPSLFAQESRLGNYRVHSEHVGGAKRAGEFNRAKYVVKDRDGNLRYTVEKEIPFDVGFPAAHVFESGRLLLVDAFHAAAEFYDAAGNRTASLMLADNPEPEYERIVLVSMHDTIAALLISEPTETTSWLLTVTHNGLKRREVDVSGAHASGICISSDTTIIAASTYSWDGDRLAVATHFISADGSKLGTVPVMFSNGTFNSAAHSFLGWTNREVTLVDLESFTVSWKYSLPVGRLVLDAARADEAVIVLSSDEPTLRDGGWHYRGARVEKVSSEREVRLLQELSEARFVAGRLRATTQEIQVELDGTVYRVEVH